VSVPVAGARPVTTAPVVWWRVLSWQMYDFADTIYSMNIYTYYFGIYIAFAFGKNSADFGWALTAANLGVALSAPILGAMSDVNQQRLPFLRFFAVATAVLTAVIGLSGSYWLTVTAFVLSYFCYAAASGFYQALLPGLANELNVSKVSGIGVALGYIGAIVGLGSTMLYVSGEADYHKVFLPSAVMFLLFAIPCLTVVPDFTPVARKVKFDVAASYRRVADTIRNARRYPGLFPFLVADFLYENAVSAVIGFMTVYAKVVVGFGEGDLVAFFIFSTVFAVLFSFVYGPVTDRIGPKPAVLIMLAIWLVVFPLVTFAQTPLHFRFIGPIVGIGLGATWISSRTYLISLAPVERSAEFFGLFALSGKSAGVVGTLVWTLVLNALIPSHGEVYALKAAVWAMWGFIVIGILTVIRLPNVRPTRANMLQRGQSVSM
jgi:MFS transporter, UMF1 family